MVSCENKGYIKGQKLNLKLKVGKLMEVNEDVNNDHPQFIDEEYRKRRDEIAEISQSHLIGNSVPQINYTQKEHQTWRYIYQKLKQNFDQVMSARYLRNLQKLEKDLGIQYGIPQLDDIDAYLQAETGFRIKATHGILSQREFLNALGHKVFCCTQYIRHHDKPEYSPEPDIIHEIIGHIPMLADPQIADLTQQIGLISCGIQENNLKKIGTLFWYTLEYGATLEKGLIKGYGAGIGSSIAELENFKNAQFEKLNPAIHATRNYISQDVQPVYMYSSDFEETKQQLLDYGNSLQKPFKAQYDSQSQSIKTDVNIVLEH
ncbi:hypothetical protein pb186bvf_004511 [Paramecium bursaria]